MKEKNKKIAVILAGCGNKDGSEIQETVSLILNLSLLKAEVEFFAPNFEFQPKNFLTNETMLEKRNLMTEAARITRSKITDIESLDEKQFDGLAIPGGFGVATHLSNWSEHGHKCQVINTVEKNILSFYKQSKPIAAICIAPVLLAKVLGKKHITLTIGNMDGMHEKTVSEILKTGAIHETCPASDFVSDRSHKIITTPAYMYDTTPSEIFLGISGLTKEFIEMA